MSAYNFQKEPVWLPNESSGERMKMFMKTVEDKYNLKFNDYWEFHKWTVENIPEFWAEIWDFSGVICSKTYDCVIDLNLPMEEFPKWFEGARLNVAENLLKFRDDRIVLITTGEDTEIKRFSAKQVYEETRIYAAALRKMGLEVGDRVACYMSNRVEAVVAMLAVTSIGAIWTGALPTLGANAFLSRVKQVQPKFLFTIDEFPHNKKMFYLLKNIKEITDGMPSLEKVIIVPARKESKAIKEIKNSCYLDEFKRMAYDADGTLPELVFEQLSFSHPTFINFTSGTTGLPKTIVHGFGGLLTTYRDFVLHFNGQPDDVWLSMSPVGTASWNITTNLLFAGSTVVLFEGLPFFLSPTSLWDLVDNLKLTRILVTLSILDKMENENYIPDEKHHLSSLKTIFCGGSVVKPRNYLFVLNKIKKGLQLAVLCGSTEFMGSCMLDEQTIPMYLGEISSPCLGVVLECLDDEGNYIEGEMGELAVSKPIPSMPLSIWGDVNGEKYKKSYFSQFPGKFTIGDSIIINPITKGIIVSGRSGETIKQRGCRFGSSEIYNVVKLFPEIKDCICVGQYSKERDERAILFIEMKEGLPFNQELVEKLRKRVAEELTVRHVPEIILQAPGIPYNENGKKTEIILKKIINKMPHNSESVANSECLQFYYNLPEL